MSRPPPPKDEDSPIAALPPRRLEVLQLLAKGLTNEEIGHALSVSTGTVRSHVASLLADLGATNRTEAAAEYLSWEARPKQVAAVLDRPAIAVLPILPLAEDDKTRVTAVGLTEDLASLFARYCWFPVIATTSSSNGRSLGALASEIGQALHARFLVDGTLRPNGKRGWRLTLHIDDVETGCRAWSTTQELPSNAVLAVQDEICEAIVAAAYPLLISRTRPALGDRPRNEIAAWELAHEGMSLRGRREPRANAAAIEHFDAAIARDSEIALAYFGLGLACYDAVLNQWADKSAMLDRLVTSAARCVELAPDAAEGHFLFGRYHQTRGDWDRAIEPLESAIGCNPSFAVAHATLAQSLHTAGRGDEGLTRMRHAVRLGPQSFVAGLATLHFMREEYVDAVELAERAIATNPGYPFARAVAAASAWWLGDAARGKAHLAALRDRHPKFRPESFAATFGEKVDPVARLRRALDALG